MPVNLNCEMFFGSNEGKGWAEKHLLQADDPPGDLLPFLVTLKNLAVNLRRPLLGEDCYLKGLRVSYATASGNVRSSPDRFQPLLYPGNSRPSSAPSSAAQMYMGESTNSQWSKTFLRGFWRDVQRDEQLDFTTSAGIAWKQLLDQYVAGLVGLGFGFQGQFAPTTRKGQVNTYAINPNGTVTFTILVIAGPALPAIGNRLSIRIAKLNGSKSVLNTTHVVTVDSPTQVTTVVPTAALPFDSAGIFTISSTSFLAYTGMQYCILARRPMGRPTLASRSRRAAQPKG